MNKIYIELPTAATDAKVSVPCRKEGLLWQFQIIFTELKNSRTRIVTVCDNGCEGEKRQTIQSKFVENKNYRVCEFQYEINEDNSKMSITLSVIFCKNTRLIVVEW